MLAYPPLHLQELIMPELVAAIVYDFDGTLARGNLQETSFIPDVGLTSSEFWTEVKRRTRESDADEILVYMHLMLEKAREKGRSITIEDLRRHGERAPLFPGLEGGEWFRRINGFAAQQGFELRHYVVSSGMAEMIEGCSIKEHFKYIFASKYIYRDGEADWPGLAINYTTKTQYLFRINKGIENCWDNEAINKYMRGDERPVPFDRMIFLGDGETDIPTMKMLTYQGGSSVAVYDEKREAGDLAKIHRLISDDRVEFVAPANYEENSQIDIIVKGIIGRMARKYAKQ
jgi:hypothetical protein